MHPHSCVRTLMAVLAAGALCACVVKRPKPAEVVSVPTGSPSSGEVVVVQPAAEPAKEAPAPAARKEPPRSSTFARPGFAVYEQDGRIWVFRDGSDAHGEFLASGEPAKRVTRVGAGPKGRTVVAENTGAIDAYLAAWPPSELAGGAARSAPPYSEQYAVDGFVVFEEDGRLWAFRPKSEHLREYLTKGEPAKRVTLVGEGPDGKTVMGAESEVVGDYVLTMRHQASGFVVMAQDGRLWVFRAGGDAYREFQEHGEPAKRVTLVGAGPDGKTLLGAERSTLDAYRTAKGL